MKKTCFVVMGFGKKMDYRNAKEVDLDIIYNDVIKELFETEFDEYNLIRADEISGSDIIDVSMYSLLIKADLVIADISTSNENALYELGIRHALRPFSTIIMMQKSESGSIPFDLSHNRILSYNDYGEVLNDDEADKIKVQLKKFVIESEKQNTDSPFYTYLPYVTPPEMDDDEYSKVLDNALKAENTISELMSKAKMAKHKNNFKEATSIWGNLHCMLPNNEYITQQFALATYKAELPNKTMALQNALEIINTLNPSTSLDLETLGITGAIYKRLYLENDNYAYLDEAIKFYHKGYIIKNDYYNGENYANCLLMKSRCTNISEEEISTLKYLSKKTYEAIIDILLPCIEIQDIDYWMYATLSTCYYALGNIEEYEKYKKLFFIQSDEWEKKTFKENIELITVDNCKKM